MPEDPDRLDSLLIALGRLADVGERLLARMEGPSPLTPAGLQEHIAFRWERQGSCGYLRPALHPDLPALADLLGIDRALDRLRRNTRQFVRGLPANNVLLWGERGSGKSSAIKGLLGEFAASGLRLVEVSKGDLQQLPLITERLRDLPFHFILFCDDLSFDETETGYRELKALLEGGISSRPNNVLVYATSNRRHLMPERLAENTGEAEIHPEEAVWEKLSLSDRFGIAIGFYPMEQEKYLAIVRHLAARRQLRLPPEDLERQACQWALSRGTRSGRVARQFIDDLAGRLGLVEMENGDE